MTPVALSTMIASYPFFCVFSCLRWAIAPKILTPWRESPAPDKEAFMTFWLTRDALVHVCMDSRTPTRKLPSWLEYAGFRKMPVRVLDWRCLIISVMSREGAFLLESGDAASV